MARFGKGFQPGIFTSFYILIRYDLVWFLTAPGEGLHPWLFFIRRNVSALVGCVGRDQNLRSKPTVLGVIKTAIPVFS